MRVTEFVDEQLLYKETGDWKTRVYITAYLGAEYQEWLHGKERPEIGEICIEQEMNHRVGYISRIDASPSGRGYGSLILSEGLRRMKEHGMSLATVYIENRNIASKSLFRKAGFIEQPEKEWETQYGRYWNKKL